MYRIDSPGSVAGAWVDRDPVGAIPGTQFVAAFENEVQEELVNLVLASGLALAKGTRTQVRDALKRIFGGFVTTVVFADSPKALTLANAGLVLVDASGGNVVLNLPAANVLPGALFLFVRTDNSANAVTVNRAGADTFDAGLTSFPLAGRGTMREIRSDGVSVWRSTSPVTSNPTNRAVNGGGDIDQVNVGALGTVATGLSGYGPDKWFLRNASGVNATIQRGAAIANTPGVKYQIEVKSAGAGGATGPELYYIFDELESEELCNQVASMAASIAAFGLVTQVGVQFVYKTTAAKFDGTNVIGAEVLVAVGAGVYSAAAILAQALGTPIAPGTGIYGVRFRITAVSAGNIAANGNGFAVTQFQVCPGPAVMDIWKRSGTAAAELAACERQREKTYDVEAPLGTTTTNGGIVAAASGAFVVANIRFRSQKRNQPTLTVYSTDVGTSGQIYDATSVTDIPGAVLAIGRTGAYFYAPGGATDQHIYQAHIFADASI